MNIKEVKYCGSNEINSDNAFENSIRSDISIYVTDLYHFDSFCSIKVNPVLTYLCEMPHPKCTCKSSKQRRLLSLISAIIILGSFDK